MSNIPERKQRFLPIIGGLNVVTFLAKHWQAIAIVGLLAGIVIYHQYRSHTINSLRADLQLCENDREEYAQLINKQNERIKALVDKGRVQRHEFEKLQAEIQSSQQSVDQRIENILNEPKPQTCEGAIQYLLETRKELAWPE